MSDIKRKVVHILGELANIERNLLEGLDEDYKNKIEKASDPAGQPARRMARLVAGGAVADVSKPKKPTLSKAHDRTAQQVSASARRERRAPVRDRHRAQ